MEGCESNARNVQGGELNLKRMKSRLMRYWSFGGPFGGNMGSRPNATVTFNMESLITSQISSEPASQIQYHTCQHWYHEIDTGVQQ